MENKMLQNYIVKEIKWKISILCKEEIEKKYDIEKYTPLDVYDTLKTILELTDNNGN